MRRRIPLACLSLAALGLAWACSGHTSNAAAGPDASDDSAADTSVDSGNGLPDIGPAPDVIADTCTLSNKTSDPVALCTQEQVLRAELQYAYVMGKGVAPGWSSTGTYAALGGHAWQDDLGLAGALGAYYCSAQVYGNTRSNTLVLSSLGDLTDVLLGELQTTPAPYQGSFDGQIYFRLRWAQAAFFYVDSTKAGVIAALADAFGASLASQAYAVAGAGDGGSPGGTVIGTKNTDGTVTYAPAQSVMAAAALLDMAALGSTDAGASAWTDTAQQVLAYVLSRGKDPTTGLFYQSLVTSADPTHDTPMGGTPTSDTILTETQAWVVLGLARAQDRLDAILQQPDSGLPDGTAPQEAYLNSAGVLASAMTSANLFDGNSGTGNPPPPGDFMEGLVLSSGQLLTNKTTVGNATILGGLHRVVLGGASNQSHSLGEIRTAFLQFTPANSSLFTIVTNGAGQPEQQAYLRAGSKAYGYALAYPEDAGVEEQGARNYRSDAVNTMIEGFDQLWRGAPTDTVCAP